LFRKTLIETTVEIHGDTGFGITLIRPAATFSHRMGEGIDFVGRLPGVVALRQRRANFRSAFSAFEFALIREIRVKGFCFVFSVLLCSHESVFIRG
jgi:hypothetical protein